MMIISFAWTTAALLAGVKRCTRRNWSDDYARRFRQGMEVQGWDRGPRVGGHQVAVIWLTTEPYPERMSDAPDKDFAAEGLEWMEQKGMFIRGVKPSQFWEDWKKADELVYVVRFQLMKVLD